MAITIKGKKDPKISVTQGSTGTASIVVKNTINEEAFLRYLKDVDATNLHDGYILIYDNAADKFVVGPADLSYLNVGDYVANVVPGTGILVDDVAGSGAVPIISLAPTSVTAGTYGNASPILIPILNVDEFGRLTNVQTMVVSNTQLLDSIKVVDGHGSGLDADTLDGLEGSVYALDADLTTANVTELNNLYFTVARARNVLSSGANILYNPTTGVISLDSNVLTTANVVENTNLYYTNARAREAISLVDAGGDGSLVYNAANGQFVYTGPSSSEIRAHISVVDAGGDGSLGYNSNTGVLTYTGPSPSEVRNHLGSIDLGGDGSFSYDQANGIFVYTGPSSSEVRAHFSSNTGIYYNETTGTYSIGQNVDTTSNVTFNDVHVDGTLYSNDITASSVTVQGNLIVQGTTTTVNTEEISLADNKILLNSNQIGSPVEDAGLVINRGSESNVEIRWNETSDVWQFTNNGTAYYLLPTTTTDLIEGSNLYFTTQRARNTLSAGGNLLYNPTTGVISLDSNVLNTSNVVEGSNLYFTTQRVRDSVSTGVGLDYSNVTGIVSLANTSVTAGVYGNAISIPIITVDNQGRISNVAVTPVSGITSFTSSGNTFTILTTAGSSFSASIQPNSIVLNRDTVGDYVASLVEGTGVHIAGSGGETSTPTLSIGQNVDPTLAVTFANVTAHTFFGNVSGGHVDVTGNVNASGLNADSAVIDILYGEHAIISGSLTAGQYFASNVTTGALFSNTIHGTSAEFSGYVSAGANATVAGNIVGGNVITTGVFTGDGSGIVNIPNQSIVGLTTANVAELNNLYFTTARARDSISAGTGVYYDNASGVVSIGQAVDPTSDVEFHNIEVTGNLYVTGNAVLLNSRSVTFSDAMLYLNEAVPFVVINAVGDGSNVTYTTIGDGPEVGEVASVTGMTPNTFNCAYTTIIAASGNTFTIAKNTTDVFVSGGNAHVKASVNPDLGFSGGYNDGTYRHAGFFRDATDGVWKVFENYTPEPDDGIFIDTGHATFHLANLQATTFLGNVVGNVTGRVSTLDNHSTSGLAEGSNLYFTNARVQSNVTAYLQTGNALLGSPILVGTPQAPTAAAGTSNAMVATTQFVSNAVATATSIILTDVDAAYDQANVATVIGVAAFAAANTKVATVAGVTDTVISNANILAGIQQTGYLTTANVTEVTNLYYTNARVIEAVTETTLSNITVAGNVDVGNVNTTGDINIGGTIYGDGGGLLNIPNSSINGLTTANVVELLNLYFTNARARASLSAGFGLIYDANTGVVGLDPNSSFADFASVLIYSQP